MSRDARLFSRLLGCWLLLTAAGCATLHLPTFGKQARKATARNPVMQIVGLWEPAEGRDAKGIPCRGFAGQVIFLANRGVLPVSVEGDIRIYLFDNHGTAEEQSEPVHIVNFDSGSWAQLYSWGALGPAYNVFVPYTRRDVSNAMCSLRIRLTPKNGPVVFSEMTSIELVSFPKTKDKDDPNSDSRVEKNLPMDLAANTKLRKTTTILLNPAAAQPDLLPAETTGDSVQQAAYQTDSDGKASGQDRISQLEQMVTELRAQQRSGDIGRSSNPPQRLVEQDVDSRRFKVRSADPTATSDASDSVNPTERGSLKSSNAVDPPVAERTRRHPLDDDETPARVIKPQGIRSTSHPLMDLDDEGRANGSDPKSAARRHPLLDEFDELPLRSVQPSKVIRASEPLPVSERDPFEQVGMDATDR